MYGNLPTRPSGPAAGRPAVSGQWSVVAVAIYVSVILDGRRVVSPHVTSRHVDRIIAFLCLASGYRTVAGINCNAAIRPSVRLSVYLSVLSLIHI